MYICRNLLLASFYVNLMECTQCSMAVELSWLLLLCDSCCQCREDGLHSVPCGTNGGCPCMFACLCQRTGLSRLTLVYASCHLPDVCFVFTQLTCLVRMQLTD